MCKPFKVVIRNGIWYRVRNHPQHSVVFQESAKLQDASKLLPLKLETKGITHQYLKH